MKKLLIVLVVSLNLLGCSTTDSLQKGQGGSSFEVHGKTYDEVWKAVVRTTTRSLTIVESNKEAGVLKAEKGVGLATWGEVVGVYVTPAKNGAKFYTVEVQSAKRATYQMTGQDWTMTIKSGVLAELD